MKKQLTILSFLGIFSFGFSQIITDTHLYPICDEDRDGFVTVPFSDLQSYVLDVLDIFGHSPEIYVTQAHRGIQKISHLYNNPQVVTVCGDTDGQGGYYDIAINSQGEIYVSRRNGLLQKLNTQNCEYQTIGPIHPNGQTVLALSFDHQDNLYEGGWTSQIYRANANDLTQFHLWHDFGSGNASGDFVQIGEFMYIAWTMPNKKDHLLKVTLDADNQYVSHQDLGAIRNGTFGLASEYGRLYGNSTDALYEIDLNTLQTTTIIVNDNFYAADDWWGAAGLHEALNMEISYHDELNDAIAGQNSLDDPYTNSIAYQDSFVYIRVHESTTNVTYIIPVNIQISIPPIVNSTELTECRDVLTGWATFDLQDAQPNIHPDPNLNFLYYDSIEDLENSQNPLPTTLSIPQTKTVYVKVFDLFDQCYGMAELTLNVPVNEVNYTDYIEFCRGTQAVLSVPDEFLSYQWMDVHPEDADQDLNGPEVVVSQPGIYHLEVTHPNGCNFIMTIEAAFGNGPEITNVIQNPDGSITVEVSPKGKYEYSIDGVFWQFSPTFHQLKKSEYAIQAKNKDNCYTDIYNFHYLKIPNFISPNDDGKNDDWIIPGLDQYPEHQIQIFDRNGKLFVERKANKNGWIWDGTYLGRKVPSGTYWYIIRLNEENSLQGHLTVKY